MKKVSKELLKISNIILGSRKTDRMYGSIFTAKKSELPDKLKAIAKSMGLKLQEERDGTIEIFGSQYIAERFYKIVKNMIDKKKLKFIFSSELKDIRKRLASDTQIVNYNVPFTGTITIDRKKDDEWGFVAVDDAIRDSIIDAMGFPDEFTKPDYNAHISLFDKDEVKQLPKKIEEEGEKFKFTIDNIEMCNPDNWDEVDELYMVTCSSPCLEALRAKYGFSPKMNENKHEFHMTLAIKKSREAKIAKIIANEYNFPPPREESGVMSIQEELDLIAEKLAKEVIDG